MTTLLDTPIKHEPRLRVVPRRRGETAPTTIEVPRVPDLPVQQIPSVPEQQIPSVPEPIVESIVESIFEPVFQPIITPFERAVRESLESSQTRRQYENLANAFGASTTTRRRASIVLLSPEPSDQTTAAIARLATVLADRDSGKMLLVDGDPSRRRLSRGFQLESKSGLCEILGDSSGGGRGEIVPSATRRIDVLSCGRFAEVGSGAKDSLRSWLADLRNEYRHILCDGGTPTQPLGALLAQACDAVYLVIEIGKTETVAARQAVAALRQLEASVLGCIVVG